MFHLIQLLSTVQDASGVLDLWAFLNSAWPRIGHCRRNRILHQVCICSALKYLNISYSIRYKYVDTEISQRLCLGRGPNELRPFLLKDEPPYLHAPRVSSSDHQHHEMGSVYTQHCHNQPLVRAQTACIQRSS